MWGSKFPFYPTIEGGASHNGWHPLDVEELCYGPITEVIEGDEALCPVFAVSRAEARCCLFSILVHLFISNVVPPDVAPSGTLLLASMTPLPPLAV